MATWWKWRSPLGRAQWEKTLHRQSSARKWKSLPAMAVQDPYEYRGQNALVSREWSDSKNFLCKRAVRARDENQWDLSCWWFVSPKWFHQPSSLLKVQVTWWACNSVRKISTWYFHHCQHEHKVGNTGKAGIWPKKRIELLSSCLKIKAFRSPRFFCPSLQSICQRFHERSNRRYIRYILS